MPLASTIKVDSDDNLDAILLKAAHVVPTTNQYASLQNEFIGFIHFGPNTFSRMEWGTGMEDPRIFDLKNLDTDQWCMAMKAAGMKRVIFTAKHHDGFCLWQTRYTTHGIMSSPFQDGKGDVMRALSESCRKYGLELGVYLSPADLYQIEHSEGLYGNLSEATERVIPRPIPGRPFQDTTTFRFEVDDYNEYFLNQLFELLTEYGPIHEVWLDGAHPKRKGGQQYDYLAWKELINTLAPEAVVFGRQDVRWCGNEAGKTRDTEWNIIPYQEDPNAMNHFADLTAKALGGRTELMEGRYLHYQMAETNTSIREGWFYRDERDQKVRSADDVFDMYERSVGGNSIFLLNIPPNREGRFSDEDVAVLEEVGERIQETYGENRLKGAIGPTEVLDEDPGTFQILSNGDSAIILESSEPITINRFRIQEAIATHSERVEAHALYAWQNGEWKPLATATNIGYQRTLRFPEVTAQQFKLVVSAWRQPPAIATVAAHYYRPRLPQLFISRDSLGRVQIQPRQHDFRWKPHGEDIAGNLNRGYTIYYTTD
ncbi:MAG: alpha-L-fucosidase, partial [Phaeodactylibacter sp.]|nr:alpha-L-fucosidase [Phaeodactylibacter sp.]